MAVFASEVKVAIAAEWISQLSDLPSVHTEHDLQKWVMVALNIMGSVIKRLVWSNNG